MAGTTGLEPAPLQNGLLIPKYLGDANHRLEPSTGMVSRRFAAKLSGHSLALVAIVGFETSVGFEKVETSGRIPKSVSSRG
jgi:hypothetical protein